MHNIIKELERILNESLKSFKKQLTNDPNILIPLHAGFLEASISNLIFSLKEDLNTEQDNNNISTYINHLEQLLEFANINSNIFAKKHPNEKLIFKAGYLQSGITNFLIYLYAEQNKKYPYEYSSEKLEHLKNIQKGINKYGEANK